KPSLAVANGSAPLRQVIDHADFTARAMRRLFLVVILATLHGCRASPPESAGAFQDSIAVGDIDTVARMLDRDPRLLTSTWQGRTPLRTAAERGHSEIVLLLIRRGLDPSGTEGLFGETPLHFAAENGHSSTVKALITSGASKEAQNDLGQTPLYTAARA